jgi:hypothetical protein
MKLAATRLANRCQRGATLVEFAVVFPLAILFVLALIQFGMAYMAKLQVNHATFMAARAGAMSNASMGVIRTALVKNLNVFYANVSETDDLARIGKAEGEALLDVALDLSPTILNPSPEAFKDFGIYDPTKKVYYIPNDNLGTRSLAPGPTSKENIRDANLLKLRVVYGYELKVPLIAGVIKRVMCGGSTGVEAWGDVPAWEAFDLPRCAYYVRGRIPIESYAIVEMQSRAEQSKK